MASPVLPQDRGRSRHPLHISSSSTASGTSPPSRASLAPGPTPGVELCRGPACLVGRVRSSVIRLTGSGLLEREHFPERTGTVPPKRYSRPGNSPPGSRVRIPPQPSRQVAYNRADGVRPTIRPAADRKRETDDADLVAETRRGRRRVRGTRGTHVQQIKDAPREHERDSDPGLPDQRMRQTTRDALQRADPAFSISARAPSSSSR